MEAQKDFLGFDSYKKTSSENGNNKTNEAIVEFLNEMVVVPSLGVCYLFKLICSKYGRFYIPFLAAGSYWGIRELAYNTYHLKFLNYLCPELFTMQRLNWFYKFSLLKIQ